MRAQSAQLGLAPSGSIVPKQAHRMGILRARLLEAGLTKIGAGPELTGRCE